jgi:hypothetical protein
MRAGILVGVAACSTAYQAGSFRGYRSFEGERVTLGCVDLAIARAPSEHGGAPVIRYSFGNGCNHRVTVDLATVRATGKDSAGHEFPLVAHDPRHELRAEPLPARYSTVEYIEYAGDSQPYATVCVDAGGIAADLPASEHWVCL